MGSASLRHPEYTALMGPMAKRAVHTARGFLHDLRYLGRISTSGHHGVPLTRKTRCPRLPCGGFLGFGHHGAPLTTHHSRIWGASSEPGLRAGDPSHPSWRSLENALHLALRDKRKWGMTCVLALVLPHRWGTWGKKRPANLRSKCANRELQEKHAIHDTG
jgi:hypothetical protein